MSDVPPVSAATPPAHSYATGILLMIAAVGLFAAMNMFVRLIGPAYPPLEAVFFRNTIAALIIIPFVLFSGGLKTLKTKRVGGHAFRAFAGLTSNACFFAAYQRLPLADGMVIGMSGPVFATLLAIPMLGEKVTWRRWLAIAVGFGGVLIALNPAGAVGVGSLFALTGTLGWAVTMIFVKKLSSTESPYTIVFYYMLTGSLAATAFMPWLWVTPTPEVLVYYIGAGLVGGLAQIAMTFSLKMAPASVVSPFEYTQIAWAILFDAAIWGLSPAMTTLVGAVVVVLAGMFIFRTSSH